MIPKAPIQAQILIGLFAVLAIAYGASIIRLDDTSAGIRTALPGQLLVVRMHSTWNSLSSSNNSVLAAISVTLKPTTTAYFIALMPGRSTLTAISNPCPTTAVPRCLAPERFWRIEIRVWPSG